MSAVVLASFFGAKAQTGSILVGGDVTLNTTKTPNGTTTDSKTTNFSFNPTVGYQFNEAWTAGLTGGISNSKTTAPTTDLKSSSYNVGPFVRYTRPLSEMFSIFGQLEGKFGSGKTKAGSATVSEYDAMNINLYPAVFIDLKNKFGLNFNIGGISYASNKPKGGDASSAFGVTFGKTASIGVTKNFGGK